MDRIRRQARNISSQPTGSNQSTPVRAEPSTQQALTLEEKKEILLTELKSTYKERYDAVQPIPYIKDRLYCVDKVFVEGSIEGFIERRTPFSTEGSWERLASYNHIFTDPRLKSVRRIIEGEPGYGKSTLTLQLAYDWCNGVKESPFFDADVLILLRLRQLGNVKSIYRAIKIFLLPNEPRVQQSDIRAILEGCDRVKVLLDGYDEYPERDQTTENDVDQIVRLEKFRKFEVTLTTRYLPKDFDKSETKRVKLKGFDGTARDQYIRKAITGDKNKKAFDKIKQGLKGNPILDDLCQVPLFFVTFAHMTDERKDFQKFKSVTEFFIYMMKCFHSHTRNKAAERNVMTYEVEFESKHGELDKIAFEGLNRENQQIVWGKDAFCKRVGQAFYDHYIRVGILVEEKVVDIPDGETPGENTDTKIEVSFYHKLFCEWFASFRVADIAASVNNSAELKQIMGKMDPLDLQYVFRFACGLSRTAARNIIEYLKKKKDCDKFAILCILEQNGDIEEIRKTVTELCSKRVFIGIDDSKLLQRSTVQLLQIASSHDIPICDLRLEWSFNKVDNNTTILRSGIALPSLSSLEKLLVNAGRDKPELTEEDTVGLLNYVLPSKKFRTLWFTNCTPPAYIRPEKIPEELKRKNVQVLWPSNACHLDLQSGRWKKVTRSANKMGLFCLRIFIAAVVLHSALWETSVGDRACSPVQYLEIGTRGIIQCAFTESLLAITWYDVDKGDPILFYKDGVTSGQGYESGEFDIYPNGSLVIRNVSINHESDFRATKIISGTIPTVSHLITLHTTVKPVMRNPIIKECEQMDNNICFKSVTEQLELNCFVSGSRPAVNLRWIERTAERDNTLNSRYINSTYDNVTYTSRASTKFNFQKTSFLSLIVCEASSIPLDLLKGENMILLENHLANKLEVASIMHFVKLSFPMKLPCVNPRLNLIVWKRCCGEENNTFEIEYISIFLSSDMAGFQYREYQLDDAGSLSLQSALVEHEGRYTCIYDDGIDGGALLYDVFVIVDPVPAFPVIEGCNHQQYCVLEKQIQDVLTCTVSGIRPKVTLEWKVLGQDNAISFSEQTVTVAQRDDRYDIILKAKLGIPVKPENKITLECVAVGENAEHFDLSTKIDVIFTNVHPTEETSVRIFLVPVVVVVVAVVTVILVALCIIIQKVRKRQMIKKLHTCNLEETLPMMKTKREFSEKETLFIGQIKSKYELLYDSVQPIPYIKDRMYCVDKVFVNGGVEFLAKMPEGGGHSRWESLGTYQDILSEKCLSSKRQILEGEPGYGKSTLTLQLLYDWCQSVHTSPLINIDVVIYLRLRQLGGVNSIYSAIRQFILPKDSNINDEDVKEMLHSMDSVLVLLDGFDEYPDQDSAETDIFHILKKNMLQGIKVVLTTRVSCLPKDFAPRTERVRLQGFDEAAHRTYIRKAVVGEDDKAVEKLMRKLQKNPLLDDLCQVPLFFVMFAHITYDNENMITFNSVTSFFRYMISCFHSHMRIKMKDENVQKFELLENDHKALDKIAFEALSRKKQKIVWDKEKLRNQLGCEFYDRYFRIGILVEEEVLDIADEVSDESHIQYKKEVRFYHKLFCEWYAAYYVAECLSATSTENVHSFLDKLDPFELQYVYRFVCGLDKIAAEKVIQYLQSKDDGKKFAVLCMLEQEEKTENFIKRVSDLVSSGVTSIGSDESKLLQRSTLQILGVASKHKIPVSCLVLDKSFANADQNEITLKSGLRVPIMLLLEKLEIRMEKGREVTQEELLSVWRYVQQCQKLKRLSFNHCFLPASIPVEHISSVIKSKHLKVFWKPLDYEFALEIESGKWKINSEGTSKLSTEDRQSLHTLMSTTVTLSKDDSKHFQGYMIELLHNASCHKIPIYCVNLANAFKELDGDGNIILCSGLSLPILTSLEILDIQTEKCRKISQNEVNATLEYIQYCPRFKQLMFDGCLLPSSVTLGPSLSKLESKNINVFCFPDGREGRHYKLHFQSGHWLLDPGTSSVFPLKPLERY